MKNQITMREIKEIMDSGYINFDAVIVNIDMFKEIIDERYFNMIKDDHKNEIKENDSTLFYKTKNMNNNLSIYYISNNVLYKCKNFSSHSGYSIYKKTCTISISHKIYRDKGFHDEVFETCLVQGDSYKEDGCIEYTAEFQFNFNDGILSKAFLSGISARLGGLKYFN